MFKKIAMAAALFVAACAAPYDLPADDRAAISTRITNFERAFSKGDTNGIIGVVPPRMIQSIAAKGGISETVLRREMAKSARRATQKVKVLSFGMALDQATFLTTPSGRPYGLIPTQTRIQAPSGLTVQSNNSTLTVEDGGEWYLIRVDDAGQIELLREVYPDFQGVSFPKGTSKVIQ
ncbi:hypothetical protein [Sulfitobacter donghicola]|uniref:Lipoprotein n=1 Tax=Sulfitobacter donghicola DSW-25 = KCTC 12864 = JCM 14565 TaxID=1300350 RepID=A0A073IEG0_9RHOB|nr:hypothetical protein [Sulfitobacter donghicola]KEJ88114.1 hypothetical protein DSW25_17610 [Sulfitobacter donghicola DSW-25 = KCTC 12864 = JCM 14565]KIN68694.1 hypothetical protein Z948_2425 [Sulfitobacter donghicola DSW-25 = KCTC 12864 = JCM 14565]